jgi:hypothetical protein
LASAAQAGRKLVEASMAIDGQQRHYFHLYDTSAGAKAVPILLISGSGCRPFAHRIPAFFERYPAPLDVYFLEKTGIEKTSDGEHCSQAFQHQNHLPHFIAGLASWFDPTRATPK